MTDNELKAHRITALCNFAMIASIHGAMVALYSLSHSWHSLWPLIAIPFVAPLRTAQSPTVAPLGNAEK